LVFDVVIFVVLTFPRSYDTSDLEPKYKWSHCMTRWRFYEKCQEFDKYHE
jgi:hypothetical protein